MQCCAARFGAQAQQCVTHLALVVLSVLAVLALAVLALAVLAVLAILAIAVLAVLAVVLLVVLLLVVVCGLSLLQGAVLPARIANETALSAYLRHVERQHYKQLLGINHSVTLQDIIRPQCIFVLGASIRVQPG